MFDFLKFFEKLTDAQKIWLSKYSRYIYKTYNIATIILFLCLGWIFVMDDSIPIQIKKDSNIYSSVGRICIYENGDIFKECIEFGDNKKIVKIVNKKVEFVDDICIINIEVK